MKLDNVKFENGRPYIDHICKSGKAKGKIYKFRGGIITCLNCGKKAFAVDIHIRRGEGKFCSHKCAMHLQYHPQWKGKTKTYLGYVCIRNPAHPYASKRGWVYEHRLVIEKQIGRYLKPKEAVHHINEIRNDNRPENLMAFKNNGIHRTFGVGKSVNSEDIIFDGRKLKVENSGENL